MPDSDLAIQLQALVEKQKERLEMSWELMSVADDWFDTESSDRFPEEVINMMITNAFILWCEVCASSKTITMQFSVLTSGPKQGG